MAGRHRISQPKDYGIIARQDDGSAVLQCAALPPSGTYSVSFWFLHGPPVLTAFFFPVFLLEK